MRFALIALVFISVMVIWRIIVAAYFTSAPESHSVFVVGMLIGASLVAVVTYYRPDFFSAKSRLRARLQHLEADE